MTDYPRTNERGDTVWACCESSIGQPCAHKERFIFCPSCGVYFHPLDVFPGGICLNCYKVTPEANRDITAEELTRMWGGK